MKISKIMLLAVAALGLSSCMNEDFQNADTRQGSMSLVVDKLAPTTTRAVDTDNFPVNIYTAEGEIYKSFAKATDVPNKLKMPVGKYYAEAHTPGELKKYMDAPYYSGRDDFEILQAVNTNSKIVCRMANGSITVKFGNDEVGFEDFKELFADWSVTISDSKESSLIFTKEEHGYEPPTTYIKFAENVEVLTLTFAATNKNGASVKASYNLTKANASEKYDNDETCFSGGDAITVRISAVEKTDGDITGIEVNANIKFEESEEDYEMEVEDNTDMFPEWEDPNTPEETGPISLKLPNHMILTPDTDPALGNTYITAENGIQSILVKVSSTSAEMMSSLADLNDEHGVDFVNGADIVDNQNVVNLFIALNNPLSVPSAGDTEYTFPIGNFFGLLKFLDGQHTFEMVVTDMQGNKKKGKLVLAVNDVLPEIEDETESTESNITLNLPKNMTVSGSTDPTLGNTFIGATNGLKSIKVKISSSSDEMISSLNDLNKEHGVDFVNGADIVDNQNVVSLFIALNKPLSVPSAGDTEYTFPIGNFFGLLQFLSGSHTFDMVVTDMNDETKSGKLILTVE